MPGFAFSLGGLDGAWSAFTQLIATPRLLQLADHPETRKRCAGRLHELFGSNMWSWRTKLRAYAQ